MISFLALSELNAHHDISLFTLKVLKMANICQPTEYYLCEWVSTSFSLNTGHTCDICPGDYSLEKIPQTTEMSEVDSTLREVLKWMITNT